MCGIAGFVNLNHDEADKKSLENMALAMFLRGPDGQGIFTYKNTGLSHRRLSVIDLENGNQPMLDAESNVIVFNGEIFNYRELRSSLKSMGDSFATSSDTEVLLKACARYRSKTPFMLNGFFAFAFLDTKNSKLLLARDRLGVKPLFYFITQTRFAFASELAALKTLPDFPNEMRNDALTDYLNLGFIPKEKTIYKNVFKLLPGHTLELDTENGDMRLSRFYQAQFNEKLNITYKDACATVREIMTDAVKKRLNADVPAGVFLSGGLDSTIVTALAAKISENELQCFSIGFNESRYDETCDAIANANFIRSKCAPHTLKHHLKKVDPCDFAILGKLVRRAGEPYADASMLPTALLCAFAREHVTVALTGDGADELFAGYERYLAMKYLSRISLAPKKLLALAASAIPESGERTFSGRLKRFLSTGAMPKAEQYEALLTHAHAQKAARIIAPDFRHGAFSLSSLCKPAANEAVEALMELDVNLYLPDDILVKADICSMAASLEARNPFLDCRMADFAFSIPRKYKQSGTARKRILCDAFSDIIPYAVTQRRKKGFGVPVSDWFRNEWNAPLKEHILHDNGFGIFNKSELEKMIREHEERKADHGTLLFYLLMFSLWHEQN